MPRVQQLPRDWGAHSQGVRGSPSGRAHRSAMGQALLLWPAGFAPSLSHVPVRTASTCPTPTMEPWHSQRKCWERDSSGCFRKRPGPARERFQEGGEQGGGSDARGGGGFQGRRGQASSTAGTRRSRKVTRGTLLPTARQGPGSRADPPAGPLLGRARKVGSAGLALPLRHLVLEVWELPCLAPPRPPQASCGHQSSVGPRGPGEAWWCPLWGRSLSCPTPPRPPVPEQEQRAAPPEELRAAPKSC